MKIRQITRIAIAAASIYMGADYGYRKWQEEPVDKYVSAEIGSAASIDSRNSNIHEFVTSLDKNRAGIMRELKLTDEQYKNYRNLAIGIAKEETNFGLDYSSSLKKHFPETARFLKSFVSKITRSKNDKLSEGMTNFKITLLNETEAEMKKLRKLGVLDITKPSQSAVATVVHLDFLSKKFPTYLANFPQPQAEQITLNEYLLARWKSLRPSIDSIRERILSDRTAVKPKGYVGKILRSVFK